MISNDTFSAVFGASVEGDAEAPAALTKEAHRAGFAVVLIDPADHKNPLCLLSAPELKARNKEIQEAALAAGDPNWARRKHTAGANDCGVYHAFSDFTEEGRKKAGTAVARMIKRHGRVNFAVAPGHSLVDGKHRLLVVDFDTAAEKEAFYAEWSRHVGQDVSALTGPTVVSPGKVKVDADGQENWVHKDGGHHWFLLPEGIDLADLPQKKIKGPGGWVAMFGRGVYALVPPSVRAEGPYRLTGQAEMIPDWLLAFVTGEGARVTTQRAEKVAKAKQFADDPIDGWASATDWAGLLGPDEWTSSGLLDTCDCPIWTRPGGDHSSPKSATAHQPGCVDGRYDTSRGHGPLHLWTDNPPEWLAQYLDRRGLKTVSKLQYVAARDYSGDDAAAMRALDLARLTEAGQQPDPYAHLWADEEPPGDMLDETVTAPADEVGYGPDEEPSKEAVTSENPVTVSAVAVDAVEYPASLAEIALAARAARLPKNLSDLVRQAAEREWAHEEYRRLKNRASAEEIRTRMRLSIDRLSDVEEDDEEDLWRIRGLWLQKQIVMLTARWKAGKTTMVTNVVRSLVDGAPFLGQFETTPVDGAVVIVNAEMTRRQFNRWMFESNIQNRDKVLAFHVREAGPSSGDILDPTRRDELVALLNEVGAKVLILDPLNPLLSSAGVEENSSTDVAKWFTALGDVIERTQVEDVMLVHHFGHAGQRGRGSSKFMDAPDALWTYTMDEQKDEETDEDDDELLGPVQRPAAPRYLSAVGRDVDLPKSVVNFDPETRVLTVPTLGGLPMTASASRRAAKDRKSEQLVQKVVKAVNNHPGSGWTSLFKSEINGNLDSAKAARDEALARGLIENRGDPDRMRLYPTLTT